jgi:hypothetical protein
VLLLLGWAGALRRAELVAPHVRTPLDPPFGLAARSFVEPCQLPGGTIRKSVQHVAAQAGVATAKLMR